MKTDYQMSSEDVRDMALALAKADKEDEVVTILSDKGLWDNDAAWKELGHEKNIQSATIVHGQQNNSVNALVEKLVNSVDAVIMRERLIKNITPKSMKEAQEKLFNIPDGNLYEMPSRNEWAKENICLVATGSRGDLPSYAIIDQGMGQPPSQFSNSFLNLAKSNKAPLDFVQGKFGAGGTGALRFCSKNHRLQLIISKRCPDIKEANQDTRWGLTVMRKQKGQDGLAAYAYLTNPHDSTILSFNADNLAILPQDGKSSAYGKELRHGTFIKLYEYEVDSKFSTGILTIRMRNRLEMRIPDIALPIRMYERREWLAGGSHSEATLAGLTNKLLDDPEKYLQEVEGKIFHKDEFRIGTEKIGYQFLILKEKKNKDGKKTPNDPDGIIFTLNGQAHSTKKRSFFRRKSIGFGFLSDHLLVLVDFSHLKDNLDEVLTVGREDTPDSVFMKSVEKKLENVIATNKWLKTAEIICRGKHFSKKPQEDGKIFENFFKSYPNLFKLKGLGKGIPNLNNINNKPFMGMDYPTKFKPVPEQDFSYQNPKEFAKNEEEVVIKYKTDVYDEYFSSGDGDWNIYLDDKKIDDAYLDEPYKGRTELHIPISSNMKVRNYRVTLEVTRPAPHEPIRSEAFFKIVEQKSSHKGVKTKRDNDKANKNKTALPKYKKVKREDWEKNGMDEFSALKVVSSMGEHNYFVNVDNIHLIEQIDERASSEKNSPKTKFEGQFAYGMVILGMAILERENNKKQEPDKNKYKQPKMSVEEKVAEFTSAVAPAILPIINYFGQLDEKIFKSLAEMAEEDDEE